MVQSGVRIKPHFDHVDIRDKTLATATEMAERVVKNSFEMGFRLCHGWASQPLNLMGQVRSRQTGPPKPQRPQRFGPQPLTPKSLGRRIDDAPGETSKLNNCSHFP
jgi:hypothetical protein